MHFFKGWIIPAFLFLITLPCEATLESLVNNASRLNLDTKEKWLSLLHLKNGAPQIKDTSFILSYQNNIPFDPKTELYETLKLFQNDTNAICRFPARYLFLSAYLALPPLDFNKLPTCSKLQKYLNYVPFENVNLIFASEVLSSASSMMGHTFLNVSGNNTKNNDVSHSISFFTEFSSFNPFSLIYDGVVGGMNGFFIVRPYEVDHNRYLNEEGRNIWSYELELSDLDKQLIQLHIWELKDIEIEYLFQSYNCATLTLYVLSIANAALKNEEVLYVSPIDVVKAIKKHNMIKSNTVTLSHEWELNMLQQEISDKIKSKVEAAIFDFKLLNIADLNETEVSLAKEYLSLLISIDEIKEALPIEHFIYLQMFLNDFDKQALFIDLKAYKDPSNTPQDSLFTTEALINSSDPFVQFSFMPASHYFYGDNRQFFSESELKISEIVMRIDPHDASVKIQDITLYSMKSYNPSTVALSQFSSEFYIGYHHVYTADFIEKSVFEISGAFGKTYKIHKDVSVYGLLGFGIATNIEKNFLFIDPHFGSIINMVGNTKAILEYRITRGQYATNAIKRTQKVAIAWYGLKEKTLSFSFQSDRINEQRNNQLSFKIDYHF